MRRLPFPAKSISGLNRQINLLMQSYVKMPKGGLRTMLAGHLLLLAEELKKIRSAQKRSGSTST
jgi:hypothetical protein